MKYIQAHNIHLFIDLPVIVHVHVIFLFRLYFYVFVFHEENPCCLGGHWAFLMSEGAQV